MQAGKVCTDEGADGRRRQWRRDEGRRYTRATHHQELGGTWVDVLARGTAGREGGETEGEIHEDREEEEQSERCMSIETRGEKERRGLGECHREGR